MISDNPISVGIFDGFSWIRCEGKGSFRNSPLLKEFADRRIAVGERLLVVDLGSCSGMDSTFMGTLAGIAARLSGHDGAALQIADVDQRNRRSLEDLGLDFLMQIDPPHAKWRGHIEHIRSTLEAPHTPAANGKPNSIQRARHVLEAHQNLSAISEENAREFANVLSVLQNELTTPNPPSAPGP